jgi:hypothetical protein
MLAMERDEHKRALAEATSKKLQTEYQNNIIAIMNIATVYSYLNDFTNALYFDKDNLDEGIK